MSVVDSRDDLEAARKTLAGATEKALIRDLGYWAVVSREHQIAYVALENRQGQLRELHGEAEAWVRLLSDELLERRRGKRPEEPA